MSHSATSFNVQSLDQVLSPRGHEAGEYWSLRTVWMRDE